jgi:PEP-CTERM motif
MIDLGTLLGTTQSIATGINDAVQIVGQGLIDGQEQAFLMTPQNVPEPGTLTIFGLGLAALVILRIVRCSDAPEGPGLTHA